MILRYHEIFSGWQHQQPCRDTLVLLAWKKSHDIVILSFCNIVKGQANYLIDLSRGEKWAVCVSSNLKKLLFYDMKKNKQGHNSNQCPHALALVNFLVSKYQSLESFILQFLDQKVSKWHWLIFTPFGALAYKCTSFSAPPRSCTYTCTHAI